MTRFTLLINIISVLAVFVAPASAQTDTTFTYQGQLKENSLPVNGLYNMDFSLWDSASGGNQIGAEIMFNGQPVMDGRFTVELDFGDGAFDNTDRWLEISVNGNELDPRTPITGTPYSIQTRGIFVDDKDHVGIGNTTPERPLHVQEGSAGNFTAFVNSIAVLERDGHGYLSILTPEDTERGILFGDPESNISGGIIYNNAAVPDGFQIRTGDNQTQMVIDESGVGIGTTSPIYPLDVRSSTVLGIGVWTTGDGGTGDSIVAKCTGAGARAVTGLAFGEATVAGKFFGDVDVQGTLSKFGGSFKIDHPLDPANKFLSHSFVESPDMMNIYNGNVILDASGHATITLPEWFGALNREFRYQLTCIRGFAPVYVATEIENNQFTIAGGRSGLKVSWQVTGVRQDAWAEANRIPVEEHKVGFEAGHYLHPEVYGLDRSMSIHAAREAVRNATASETASSEHQENHVNR